MRELDRREEEEEEEEEEGGRGLRTKLAGLVLVQDGRIDATMNLRTAMLPAPSFSVFAGCPRVIRFGLP